jgi:threonine synthase
VCDELGGPPDALAIPVGNAGNITAWWRGFREYEAAPVLYGFQAEGAAPLVHGHPVAEPETIASAIRIGNPARWEEAMEAVTGSRGRIAAVSDAAILDAYHLLASREGVFCEPASAASVAGLLVHGVPAPEGGEQPRSVVCVLTGHGLKDPDTAFGKAPPVIGCDADVAAVERVVFD